MMNIEQGMMNDEEWWVLDVRSKLCSGGAFF
jgi:hypothetical protein